jgi:histidinol-phosphate aminotransferase
MKDFLSPKARGIKPYVPGEQPKDKRYIKLNTNENPYPPSPRALEAIRRVTNGDLKLYTLPEMEGVRAAAAKVEGLPGIEWAYCGNGSDEVLALAFQAFFGGDLPLLFPDITYSFYPVYCELYGIRYETVPLAEDFSINLADYGGPACGAVFPNPNAPTGIFIRVKEIEAFLDQHADRLLLLDEAYVRFGGEPAAGLIRTHPNLAIVRTLSKSHALAGLRCGLIFAQPQLIEGVIRVKNSFNSYPMSALTQAGAEAAILDDAYSCEICRKVAATRERMKKELTGMGFSVAPSLANLLFFSHPKLTGDRLYEGLRERGVLVRHFSKPERIRDHVRMSMGTDEEMDRVLKALADMLETQASISML